MFIDQPNVVYFINNNGGNTMRFSDGMTFDTSGDYRVVRKSDGLYVVGHGMLIPVSDSAEAREVISDFRRLSSDAASVATVRS